MTSTYSRRHVLAAGASMLAAATVAPTAARAATKQRFSSAFTETDLRAQAYKDFAAAIKSEFDFEPYWGNTLFKQGAELVALQCDNLVLCNLAPVVFSL